MTEAVAEEFQKSKKGKIKVTVGIAELAAASKNSAAAKPISATPPDRSLRPKWRRANRAVCNFIELPVAYDALTVIVNPKNDWVKAMTVPDLKKMWEPGAQGKMSSWNQVRNEWPNSPLKLFGPGADSGTFDYFTEAIVGKAKSSRGDFTASEDDNVLVQGVANDRNALGYFGFAYYIENQNKLRAAAIDAGKGPVMPSAKSVEDGTYQPLSRPIFIYVSKKAYDSKPEVREFVEYFLKQGPQLIRQVKVCAAAADGLQYEHGSLEERQSWNGFRRRS